MISKIFLGGTCSETTWREELIETLPSSVYYYNPVVKDWTPEVQEEEKLQKAYKCDCHLYVITPDMQGVFSVAEAVQSSYATKKTTIFAVIENRKSSKKELFDAHQKKSLYATGDLIKSNDGYFVTDWDELITLIETLSMPSKDKALIFDLDGTLFNCSKRLVHIAEKPKRWDLFYKNILSDTIIPQTKEILNRFKDDHKIILLTGRPWQHHPVTVEQLNIHKIKYDLLLMRPNNRMNEHDHDVKRDIYLKQIESFYDVQFVIEDRARVCAMWRDLGLLCFQCARGEF